MINIIDHDSPITDHHQDYNLPQTSPLFTQSGMTYLFVMMLIVFMSISLLGVSQQWSVIMKRDREEELQFRGNRIKQAIEQFVADYQVQRATRPYQWPRNLKDLTKKNPKRYLQAEYTDPITGNKFDYIMVGKELHGVRSSSEDAPYNQVLFKDAKKYSDIRFESTGASANCQPTAPGASTPSGQQGVAIQSNCIPTGGTSSSTTPSPLDSKKSTTTRDSIDQ